MSDFVEAFSQVKLGDLRESIFSGVAENNAQIMEGVYLSWDEKVTDLMVEYDSSDWASLSLDYQFPAPLRWFSLNLVLAEGRIAAGDVLGLVVEGYSAPAASMTLRLRSMIDGEVYDSEWDDTIDLHRSNFVSVALRTFTVIDGIVDREGYHTIILDLPAKECALTIRNMRLFRMPGSREMRREPETLSSFAV